MQLSDYFQPLNLTTFAQYLLLLISFDLSGTFAKSLLIKRQSDDSRIINWLIGLGLFSFVWFLIRFFLPPNQFHVAMSILILDLIALPHYLKAGEFKRLIVSCWRLRFPFLIIIPFLPAVFIKASLPPYYSDEMAYHFISPSQLAHISTWHFDGDFYPNLPQVFDLFFVLVFALTKTYSVARLFIFSTLVTAILFTFSFLKVGFGRLTAYFFVFTLFSIPQAIVHISTIGYVDIPTYSFMLIGVIFLIDFLNSSNHLSAYLSSIFWGLALGTKYTSLSAFTAILPIFFMVLPKIRLKGTIAMFFLVLIFGGYWYIKNLIAYGNPLYPMFGDSSIPFTGNWTTPINLTNLKEILGELFPQNILLQLFILISPILVFFNKSKKIKTISLFLIVTVILELIILKNFSGFYGRYHQHLQLWFLLLLAIQLSNSYLYRWQTLIVSSAFLILIVSTVGTYLYAIKMTYHPSVLTSQEVNYAIGRINIYSWVKAELPRVYDVIRWCESPPGGEISIRFIDPDMIWYEKEGYMRSFLTNCYLEKGIPLEDVPVNNLLTQAIQRKIKFISPSINQCIPYDQVKPKRISQDDLDEKTKYLRHLSNKYICHSQEIIPHLYYFNYENLNP